MGIWGAWRRVTGKNSNRRSARTTTAEGRRSKALKNRGLRLEQFEDRMLLSITSNSLDTSGLAVLQTPATNSPNALDTYVAQPDAHYRYTLANTVSGPGYTGYIYDLVSQGYQSTDVVTNPAYPGSNEWHHWLSIVVPDNIDPNVTTAFFVISGGSSKTAVPSNVDSLASSLALQTKTVVVNLPNIPNEPVQFPDVTGTSNEDGIIAYSFDKFLDLIDTDPTTAESWPLYLPMVNSVVRAMDTVQAVVPQLTGGQVQVNDFVVTGASKRGWTTQLATAVDPQGRVKAMIPIVAEVSNLAEQMAFQRRLYESVTTDIQDGYSTAVDDYLNYHVIDRLATADETGLTPEGQALLQIVDPFAYKDRANMAVPKYYVNSTGDQFFSPGSSQFYIDQMNGPTYLRYVPNTDHSLDSSPDALQSIINFYMAEVAGDTLPTYDWAISQDGSTLSLDTVTAPTQVLFWQASNANSGDFRYTYGSDRPQWSSTILVDQGGSSYMAHLNAPTSGAVAGLIEMDYLVDGKLLKFTTSVSILSAAVSPELVAVVPDSGNTIKDGDALHVAPRELRLRFNENQQIDPSTLGGIQLWAVGASQPLTPGYIGLGDSANEVVIRFTEGLPDGSYQLKVCGSGTTPLRNSKGVYFHGGQDLVLSFSLDLAPTVSAVVPQPITRGDDGALSQARNVIEVYFNNDDLDRTAAENPLFYQLIFTQGTASSGDDVVVTPDSASYDEAADKVTLTFRDDLANLGTGAARLRVGDPYATVTTSYVNVPDDAGSWVDDPTVDNSPIATALGASGGAESYVITGKIQTEPGDAYKLEFPGATDNPGERDLAGAWASNDHVGVGTSGGDTDSQITTVYYNFNLEITGLSNQETYYNLITDAQKERAREVFALYSHYLGVQFIETDQPIIDGHLVIQVARGDLTAAGYGHVSAPGGEVGVGGTYYNDTTTNTSKAIALADGAEDWGSSEFGGNFTTSLVNLIGYCLGYGYADDLTAGSLMAYNADVASDIERLFPGIYDVVHGQYMYRPDNVDVDLYKFDVATPGTFSAEINAERLANSSLLDSVVTLYKVSDQNPGQLEVVARNDDYFSKDSFLELRLEPGTYYVGVSAKGNTEYDPNVPNSGLGGTTQGAYDLRLNFVPGGVNTANPSTYVGSATEQLVDAEGGVILDGDADGVPGGTYNFWFNVQPQVRVADNQPGTIYVDKASTSATPDGSLENPYTTIPAALAVAQSGDIIRIVGNHFANDNAATPSTFLDNKPYKIGLDVKGRALEDGATLEVPQGVTVMIDAGAVFKMRLANVDVGSSSEGVDRSGGALQVLGIPGTSVYFTSNYDDSMGGSTDEGGARTARAGDWGGLVFRNDLDYDFIQNYDPTSGEAARQVLETEGIFLNYVNHAEIRYGGGEVNVDGLKSVYAPIYLTEARPTITHNYIHDSANSAISADPNSFEETRFENWDTASLYTSDYGRVGPDVRGNYVVNNSINGLFVRVRTAAGRTLHELEVPARFDDWDIVHVVSEVLVIHGTPGGPVDAGDHLEARLDGRLKVDPGVIVKSDAARIEVEMGAQLIAEGSPGSTAGSPGYPVVFTSLFDTRYGAGGTFATDRNTSGKVAAPGNWGGIIFEPTSEGSLDHAVIAYAGGTTSIEGTFASFDPVEIRQAEVRITNSRFEDNTGGGSGGDRGGRGTVTPATIFVRGAQPVLVDNLFIMHSGFTSAGANIPAISIDANSMTAAVIPDWGRATGALSAYDEYQDNYGPLVRGNRLVNNGINGLEVRGGTLATESIWDDTDIVHVVRSEIVVPNYEHGAGVLRLQSSSDASLVVKLSGATAGFTASGTPLEIDDRIGGTVQVIGTPEHPVVLTSLADDSVGAGLTVLGLPQTDTNNDGNATAPTAGSWRSVKLDTYSNDRNVVLVNEAEATMGATEDVNATPTQSQYLGLLADKEIDGDDQRALGFDIHGTIRYDAPNDVDVYSFQATAGTEVWLDIDRTRYGLDTALEFVDSTGRVLARSDSSLSEEQGLADYMTGVLTSSKPNLVQARVMDRDEWLRSDTAHVAGYDVYSTNPNDPGMRLVLPGTKGEVRTYWVRVISDTQDHDNSLGQYQTQSSGEYELQVRLRENQEVAGSTVRAADIRYATNGIEILGQPGHSPLLGETAETETTQGANNTFDTAQSVGNVLASDQASISWRGYLTGSSDVDWYKISVTAQELRSLGSVFATIFDLDYADGMARPDLSMWVFDSSGKLILNGTDSNIADDRPAPLSGASVEDLSAGSVGTLDPFIGSVYLPEQQTYYVAVTSSLLVPSALDPLTNPLTRVEPVDSISRIVEEHVETTYPDIFGNASPYYPETVPDKLRLTLTPQAFGLGDVTTYVVAGKELYTVNASSGTQVLDCTGGSDLGKVYNEIIMRNDAQLYAVATNTDNSLAYRQVDTHDATKSLSDAALSLASYLIDPVLPNELKATGDSGTFSVQAMASGPSNAYRQVYVVGNSGGPAGANYATNLLWVLDATGSPLGPSDGDVMPLAQLKPSRGGVVTGITFVGQQMYAVTDRGDFYRVDNLTDGDPKAMTWGLGADAANDGYLLSVSGGPLLTYVASLGTSFAFSGLATGPAELYPNLVFATTNTGRIYALDVAGTLQPVFASGRTYADTGIAGASGIAFSPIDYNLWHVSKTRSLDAGHGINNTFDYTRSDQAPSTTADYPKPGYESWHFGLEDPRLAGDVTDGPVAAQPGLQNFYDNSTAGTSVFNTYDAPSGARGNLLSSSFSLAEYAKADQPMLYFNYFADTEGGTSYDGLKVYISSNGGSWNLLATNIEWDLRPSEFDAPGYQNGYLQKLYDTDDATTNAWRQVRIDLGTWAGSGDLKLKFEFDTQTTRDGSADGRLKGAQNNAHEGVYIDDIIVGFAERGEMITAAPSGVTTFNTTPLSSLWYQPIVTTGSYQVEVRRGADFGYGARYTGWRFTDLGYGSYDPFGTFDTNSRLAEEITLHAEKDGSQLTHGDTFRLTDGIKTWTFILWDTTKPGTPSKGQIPVYYRSTWVLPFPPSTQAEVAGALANAINNNTTIRAQAVGTHVDLFGATRFEPAQNPTEISATTWGLDTASGYDLGDTNTVREKGQVTVDANTIEYASEYGIVVAPGARDGDAANLPHPGSGRTIGAANDLVSGVTIENNIIGANVTGGIRFSGQKSASGEPTGAIPYGRIVNNTICGSFNTGEGTADVMILMDVSGSMGWAAIAIRDQLYQLDTQLQSAGIDARYGLIIFPGSSSSDIPLLAQDLTDFATFTNPSGTFATLSTWGAVENGSMAIREALNDAQPATTVHYREGARPVLIMATDEDDDSFATDYVAASADLQAQDAVFFPIASSWDTNTVDQYGKMADDNHGALFDINDFQTDPAGFFHSLTLAILGALSANGDGITVENNASPTILNNIVCNSIQGISIDSTSKTTVLGANIYQANASNVEGASLGTFDIALGRHDSLFVDLTNGNLNLAPGSKAIDSAIQSLQERAAYYNGVLQPLGMSPSPILAPDFDFYGHLRQDDPDVSSDPGQGADIFKDRGAIDRVDFDGPQATLTKPLDNEPGVDRNANPNDVVIVNGPLLTEFAIQLSDGQGVGVNDRSITSDNVDVYRDATLLMPGLDYFFHYDPATDLIRLVPAAGVWAQGYDYKIILDNQKINDLGANPLQPNRVDGTTYFTIGLAGLDFGDAPDDTDVPISYATRLASDGARHVVIRGVHLGAGVNGESNAKENPLGNGDQFDDGVTFASHLLSGPNGSQVDVTINASVDGYINAWIDWNGDGIWTPDERIFDPNQTNEGVFVHAGLNTLTIDVPAGLTPGATFARFRFTSLASGVQTLEPTGEAPDGEVEDYMVQVVDHLEDFGDAPEVLNGVATNYATTAAHNGAHHVITPDLYLGNVAPDADMDGHPSTLADGDNKAGIDDEEGVNFGAFDAVFSPGRQVSINVAVVNLTVDPESLTGGPFASYLNAWFDFNGDGDWNDAGEHLVQQVSNGDNKVTFDVPKDAKLGTTYARFRLSTDANLPSDGYAPDGEVEDYVLEIIATPYDFGDAPISYPTTLAQDGARHIYSPDFHLGPDVDYESDGQPSADAKGDNTHGRDDEDGVTYADGSLFGTQDLIAGKKNDIVVTVLANGDYLTNNSHYYLNAWLDINGDGDWTDPGEQIFTNESLTAGVNDLSITLPRELNSVRSFARFRLSTEQNLGVTGAASDGEVEDYGVKIVAGEAKVSGYTFNDLNGDGAWNVAVAPAVPSVTFASAGSTVVAAGNDNSSTAISLGFGFQYYGKTYTQMYVNNNGTVSFGSAVSTYSPNGFPQDRPLLAPFGSDVDTRNGGGKVTLTKGTSSRGGAFVQVDWVGVGYFDKHSDLQNTFRLYLEDNAAGDIVVFNYVNMQWTSGDMDGSGGFGGQGAQIGFDAGDHLHYANLGRPSDAAAVHALNGTQYAFRFDATTGLPLGTEPVMGGIPVQIYDGDGNLVAETISSVDDPTTSVNEAGYFQFNKLFAGQYTIRQTTPDGWQSTRPFNGLTLPNGVTGQADGSYLVNLAQKSNFTDLDFGDYKTAQVGVSDVTVMEGNDGAKIVHLTLHMTESFGAPVTVFYDTVDGSATGVGNVSLFDQTGNSDYVSVSNGSIRFTPQEAPLGVWSTKKITSSTANDYDYSVSGNYVVWENYGGLVFLYDNLTGKTRQLTTGQSYDRTPAIYGNYVAWASRPVGEQDYEILLYDINSDTISRLTTNAVDDGQPKITDKYVVWSSAGVSGREIYLYNLATHGPAVPISKNAYDNDAPQIAGSHIVWTAVDGSDREIFSYDAVTKQVKQLSVNGLEDRNPIVSDKAVVWEEYDGTDYELMAYRFRDGATLQLTNNSWNDEQASISGSQVVWRGSDGLDPEIFYFDVDAGGTPINISNDTLLDEQPQILGNRVVWHAYVGNNWEVFYKDLSSTLAPLNISNNAEYDWYPKLSNEMVVWRSYLSGNYEIVVANQAKPQVTTDITLIVNGDTFVENDEDFFVHITGAQVSGSVQDQLIDANGDVQSELTAKVTILNDDGTMDFGDAPAPYPTLLADNGARHVVTSVVADRYYLGASVDTETDGRPSATANGDDTYTSDDEDGVVFGSLVAGAMGTVTVTAHCPLNTSGKLSAWIDLNGDGDWSDDGEQILTDEIFTASATSTAVSRTLSFYLPADMTAKTSFARFRFDRDGGLAPTGTAATGEVEDYTVTLKKNPYLNGLTVSIVGTTANDTFQFAAGEAFAPIHGDSYRVTYNGVNYYYPTTLINKILFYGQAGVDTATLQGSSQNDSVWLWPNQAHLLAPGLDVWAYTTEKITAKSGGGVDYVRFYDSSVTETFKSTPDVATMAPASGTAYANEADGFRYVYAFSTAGGDTANLYDSAGNDTFQSDPANSILSGSTFFSCVNLFRYVNAYGTGGGTDAATLKGSSGADSCTAAPTNTLLSDTAGTYSVRATGFEALRADGGVGADVATMTDSAGTDVFTASPTSSQLSGTGFNNILLGFETVTATSSAGGSDSALLLDSAGNDTFTASPTTASMKGTGFSLTANKFAKVTGRSSAGTDTATLNDSAGNDNFIAYPTYATMAVPGGTAYSLRAEKFRTVIGVSATGTDTAFLYDGAGDDTLTAAPTDTALAGIGYTLDAKKFANVYAYATGGTNTANFTDSTGNDSFTGRPTLSTLAGTGYQVKANNFQIVNATASSGTDLAYFYDSAGDEIFQADGATTQALAQALMKGSTFSYKAKGFDKYYAYATGGLDVATLNGTTGNDTLTGSLGAARLYSSTLFDFNVSGFDEISAYGKGGTDSATLTDSTGLSTLEASGSWAKLSQSDLYFLLVSGFKNVTANSTATGNTKSVNAIDYLLSTTGYWN